MDMGTNALPVVLVGLALAPAAAQQMYVYPSQDQSPGQQNRDQYECHLWSVQQTGVDPTTQSMAGAPPSDGGTGANPVRGAARGAAIGAVGGAIGGNVGKGAAIGAASGALIGGMRRRDQQQRQEQQRRRLGIAGQVLTFRTKAWLSFAPPTRLPRSSDKGSVMGLER